MYGGAKELSNILTRQKILSIFSGLLLILLTKRCIHMRALI